MRRITLDANVLAPGFTSQGSASARLVDLWRSGAFTLVRSDHLVRELARTATDSYFARRLSAADAEAIVALLRAEAVLTELSFAVHGVATHPEDDLVLAIALSGQASMLCTRDKQLLALGAYKSVVIISPGQAVARLE